MQVIVETQHNTRMQVCNIDSSSHLKPQLCFKDSVKTFKYQSEINRIVHKSSLTTIMSNFVCIPLLNETHLFIAFRGLVSCKYLLNSINLLHKNAIICSLTR